MQKVHVYNAHRAFRARARRACARDAMQRQGLDGEESDPDLSIAYQRIRDYRDAVRRLPPPIDAAILNAHPPPAPQCLFR